MADLVGSLNVVFNPEAAPPALPEPGELLAQSKWVREIPGLHAEAQRWLEFAPGHRAGLEMRARSIATPGMHPQGFLRLAETAGRTIGAAAMWATADRARAAYRTIMTGEPDDSRVRDAAKRAEQVVRAGGPAFVKLGQFIATAKGILPDDVVEAFEWCRDEADPLPAGIARDVVESALRKRIREIFAEFDDRPAAAASIAQVHRARLHDGREVGVKVRRPGLHEDFEGSIAAMALLAAAGEGWSPAARIANVRGFVELFSQLVFEELDFRLEALNMIEVGLAVEHAGLEFVRSPRPMPGMVTDSVLVMEWLPGVRYTDAVKRLDSTVESEQLLRLGIQAILEHTLVYGRFHGDLHAGNVLITPAGMFSLVDFGIMGRLDAHQRAALVRLVVGFATEDTESQLRALVEFGAIPKTADLKKLGAELDAASHADKGRALTYEMLADSLGRVIKILSVNGFRLPKTLVLFFKNLLYLNGFAAAVAPDANLMGQIEPIFQYFQGKYAGKMNFLSTGAVVPESSS